jgi:hypothetical protein
VSEAIEYQGITGPEESREGETFGGGSDDRAPGRGVMLFQRKAWLIHSISP